ncbi:MAG TPA: glycosyltransferase family 39 protein [Sedimentisphaerales bacterium]|nr:glycosyltransferase family 39 protein [Sedimentisphaerales bacterium]
MSYMLSDVMGSDHGSTGSVRNLNTMLAPHKHVPALVLLSLIIILGTALRLYDLGTESYWIDEIVTVHTAQQGLEQSLRLGGLDRPPTYFLIAHFWLQMFGPSEGATRLLSALFGIASIPLIFVVARELFGKRIGLLSAFFMAVSEFQIYYSQDTRFYSLFGLLTLVSFFLYIRALRSGKIHYFALYLVASILLVNSHAFGVFVLAAQNLYFFLRWNSYKRVRLAWFLCQTLILLAIAPGLLAIVWTAMRTKGLAAGKTPVADPSLRTALHSIYWYMFPIRRERAWSMVVANYIAGTILLIIGILVFAGWKGKEAWLTSLKELGPAFRSLSSRANELLLAGCWLVCPIVLAVVVSKLLGTMYDRYTISAAPAFYLLLAVGISTVRKVVPEVVSLGVLVILIAPGLRNYYVADVKEQWREAAAYVAENAEVGDVIVFAPDQQGWQQKSFDWYYGGDLPGCDVALLQKDNAELADDVSRCTLGRERFWLIARHFPGGVRFKEFYLNSRDANIRLLKQHEFTGISVYLFELPRS